MGWGEGSLKAKFVKGKCVAKLEFLKNYFTILIYLSTFDSSYWEVRGVTVQ